MINLETTNALLNLVKMQCAIYQPVKTADGSHNLASNDYTNFLFFEIQKAIQPSLSIEAGAHDAPFSRQIAGHFPNTKVMAFEASPVIYMHYDAVIDYSKFRVEYINKAISAKDGHVDIDTIIDPKSGKPLISGSGSILNRDRLLFLGETIKKVSVESTSLDNIIASQSNVTDAVLWIDVEGANREVLNGCKTSLEQKKIGTIHIEVSSIFHWKNQWLDADVNNYLVNMGMMPIMVNFTVLDNKATASIFHDVHMYDIIYVRNDLIETILPPYLHLRDFRSPLLGFL